MIVGVGVDIIEIDRIARLIEKYGDRFLRRVFLPGEIAYCRRRKRFAQSFAARVAAKEAASKALGTGWSQGVHWKCVEVARGQGGPPRLVFHQRGDEVARLRGVTRSHLSLSHCETLSIAYVVLEGDEAPGGAG